MTRDEYDERRRRIEDRHRATIELIEAGRQAQLRALDLVWLAAGDGGAPPSPRLEEPARRSPAPRSEAAPEVDSAPVAPSPGPAKRRGVYALLGQIEAVLDRLPEVFDHHDLNRALGVEVDRGAVRRNLRLLVEEEVLALEPSTSGRFHHRYRKLGPRAPAEDD